MGKFRSGLQIKVDHWCTQNLPTLTQVQKDLKEMDVYQMASKMTSMEKLITRTLGQSYKKHVFERLNLYETEIENRLEKMNEGVIEMDHLELAHDGEIYAICFKRVNP